MLFALFEEKSGRKSLNIPASILKEEHIAILECHSNIGVVLDSNSAATEPLEENLMKIFKSHQENEVGIVYPWLDEILARPEPSEISPGEKIQVAKA